MMGWFQQALGTLTKTKKALLDIKINYWGAQLYFQLDIESESTYWLWVSKVMVTEFFPDVYHGLQIS